MISLIDRRPMILGSDIPIFGIFDEQCANEPKTIEILLYCVLRQVEKRGPVKIIHRNATVAPSPSAAWLVVRSVDIAEDRRSDVIWLVQ